MYLTQHPIKTFKYIKFKDFFSHGTYTLPEQSFLLCEAPRHHAMFDGTLEVGLPVWKKCDRLELGVKALLEIWTIFTQLMWSLSIWQQKPFLKWCKVYQTVTVKTIYFSYSKITVVCKVWLNGLCDSLFPYLLFILHFADVEKLCSQYKYLHWVFLWSAMLIVDIWVCELWNVFELGPKNAQVWFFQLPMFIECSISTLAFGCWSARWLSPARSVWLWWLK